MKNEKMSFRETRPVLQLTLELQIKNKTVMGWSSQKRGRFLYHLFCLKGTFLRFVCYLNV